MLDQSIAPGVLLDEDIEAVTKIFTQMEAAAKGETTPIVHQAAERENLTPEQVRNEMAAGTIVIPANRHHSSLQPVGIGTSLKVKINANIGNSTLSGDIEQEMQKLDIAVDAGADAVMDLSTGEGVNEIRAKIMERASVPIGTVPIYEAICEVEEIKDLTLEQMFQVIERQAKQGVDFMTIHAGLLYDHLAMAKKRELGVVSRGGALMGQWMKIYGCENPFYEHFDRLLAICHEHEVTLSLGDGLRPGCIADASDEAQFAELKVLGDLVRRCRAAGVQAMVEGPGHVPLNEIQMNIERQIEECDGAPFYILGPLVTDSSPGYDHITSAIGGAMGAWYGAAMLCYITPKEHLGLPNVNDVREGVVAYKIAAHAADVAKGNPQARERDLAMARARAGFDWKKQMELSIDPERASALREEAIKERQDDTEGESGIDKTSSEMVDAAQCEGDVASENEEYCTMCGPKFCPMRVFRDDETDA